MLVATLLPMWSMSRPATKTVCPVTGRPRLARKLFLAIGRKDESQGGLVAIWKRHFCILYIFSDKCFLIFHSLSSVISGRSDLHHATVSLWITPQRVKVFSLRLQPGVTSNCSLCDRQTLRCFTPSALSHLYDLTSLLPLRTLLPRWATAT